MRTPRLLRLSGNRAALLLPAASTGDAVLAAIVEPASGVLELCDAAPTPSLEDARQAAMRRLDAASIEEESELAAILGCVVAAGAWHLLVAKTLKAVNIADAGLAQVVETTEWISVPLELVEQPEVGAKDPVAQLLDLPLDGVFYYSETLNLTEPFPRCCTAARPRHTSQFCWNDYLANAFDQIGLAHVCPVLLQGTVSVAAAESATGCGLTLLTRRNILRRGSLYTTPGLDAEGQLGNTTELEVIVSCAAKEQAVSFAVHRASLPSFYRLFPSPGRASLVPEILAIPAFAGEDACARERHAVARCAAHLRHRTMASEAVTFVILAPEDEQGVNEPAPPHERRSQHANAYTRTTTTAASPVDVASAVFTAEAASTQTRAQNTTSPPVRGASRYSRQSSENSERSAEAQALSSLREVVADDARRVAVLAFPWTSLTQRVGVEDAALSLAADLGNTLAHAGFTHAQASTSASADPDTRTWTSATLLRQGRAVVLCSATGLTDTAEACSVLALYAAAEAHRLLIRPPAGSWVSSSVSATVSGSPGTATALPCNTTAWQLLDQPLAQARRDLPEALREALLQGLQEDLRCDALLLDPTRQPPRLAGVLGVTKTARAVGDAWPPTNLYTYASAAEILADDVAAATAWGLFRHGPEHSVNQNTTSPSARADSATASGTSRSRCFALSLSHSQSYSQSQSQRQQRSGSGLSQRLRVSLLEEGADECGLATVPAVPCSANATDAVPAAAARSDMRAWTVALHKPSILSHLRLVQPSGDAQQAWEMCVLAADALWGDDGLLAPLPVVLTGSLADANVHSVTSSTPGDAGDNGTVDDAGSASPSTSDEKAGTSTVTSVWTLLPLLEEGVGESWTFAIGTEARAVRFVRVLFRLRRTPVLRSDSTRHNTASICFHEIALYGVPAQAPLASAAPDTGIATETATGTATGTEPAIDTATDIDAATETETATEMDTATETAPATGISGADLSLSIALRATTEVGLEQALAAALAAGQVADEEDSVAADTACANQAAPQHSTQTDIVKAPAVSLRLLQPHNVALPPLPHALLQGSYAPIEALLGISVPGTATGSPAICLSAAVPTAENAPRAHSLLMPLSGAIIVHGWRTLPGTQRVTVRLLVPPQHAVLGVLLVADAYGSSGLSVAVSATHGLGADAPLGPRVALSLGPLGTATVLLPVPLQGGAVSAHVVVDLYATGKTAPALARIFPLLSDAADVTAALLADDDVLPIPEAGDNLGGLRSQAPARVSRNRSATATPLLANDLCARVVRRMTFAHESLVVCLLKAPSMISGFRVNTRLSGVHAGGGQGIRTLSVTVLEGARETWTASEWAGVLRSHKRREIFSLPSTHNTGPLVYPFAEPRPGRAVAFEILQTHTNEISCPAVSLHPW